MERDIRTKILGLYNQLDSIGWDISEVKQDLEELELSIRKNEGGTIKDISNLIRELRRDGLYTNKIEEFLENYMKYYNK